MIIPMKYTIFNNLLISPQDIGITQQNSKIPIATTYF